MGIPALQKVKGHPNLRRDSRTRAILNVDPTAAQRHERVMTGIKREQARDGELASLKTEVAELREMVHQLLMRTLSL